MASYEDVGVLDAFGRKKLRIKSRKAKKIYVFTGCPLTYVILEKNTHPWVALKVVLAKCGESKALQKCFVNMFMTKWIRWGGQ